MTEIGENHLKEDQMRRIIAAILTVGSLGSHATTIGETVKRYEDFQEYLKRVSSRGFGNSP